MRPLIGRPDLLYSSYPGYGVFEEEPHLGRPVSDAKYLPQRYENLLQAIEAVINKNVRNTALLLHGIGKGRTFGRNRAGVNYKIGPVVVRRLSDAFRGAVLAKLKDSRPRPPSGFALSPGSRSDPASFSGAKV